MTDISTNANLIASLGIGGAASTDKNTTLISIDGLCGSGKTTLANLIRREIADAAVITADDFYRPITNTDQHLLVPKKSYEYYFDWRRMRDSVISPLARGLPISYYRHDWRTNVPAEYNKLDPKRVVIVEGVFTTRPELRKYFDKTIFVSTPRDQRISRIVERYYEDTVWLHNWMATEDWYMETVQPAKHVDVILDGSDVKLS